MRTTVFNHCVSLGLHHLVTMETGKNRRIQHPLLTYKRHSVSVMARLLLCVICNYAVSRLPIIVNNVCGI